MSWGWSHTDDAYINAENNLILQPKEWLNECYAEWQASAKRNYLSHINHGYDLKPRAYKKWLAKAKLMPADVLAAVIWRNMSELRSCTNGGHLAHACPFGCHTVSFSCDEVAS